MWSLIVILWCQYRRHSKEVLSRKLCTIKATNSKGTLNMFLRRSSPSSSMAWGKRHLGGGAVQWELGDGETDEAEAHQDCGDDADEERSIVSSADALVEPLAVVVKDVDTPVTMVGVILVILGFQVVIQGDKQSRALWGLWLCLDGLGADSFGLTAVVVVMITPLS